MNPARLARQPQTRILARKTKTCGIVAQMDTDFTGESRGNGGSPVVSNQLSVVANGAECGAQPQSAWSCARALLSLGGREVQLADGARQGDCT